MFHPDALDFDGRVERRKAFLKSHPDAHERMEVWYAQMTSASQSEAIGLSGDREAMTATLAIARGTVIITDARFLDLDPSNFKAVFSPLQIPFDQLQL